MSRSRTGTGSRGGIASGEERLVEVTIDTTANAEPPIHTFPSFFTKVSMTHFFSRKIIRNHKTTLTKNTKLYISFTLFRVCLYLEMVYSLSGWTPSPKLCRRGLLGARPRDAPSATGSSLLPANATDRRPFFGLSGDIRFTWIRHCIATTGRRPCRSALSRT